MKLKKFIKKYVRHNTLIRLWHKERMSNGYMEIIPDDKPRMEHEWIKTSYKNYKVLGVTDILIRHSCYTEAVNIILERK